MAPDIRDVIECEHVIIVAGLGLGAEAMRRGEPLGYRVHQRERSDEGVHGRSSAIGTRKPESESDGRVWAAHAGHEIANWPRFLLQLYRLYAAVTDARRDPHADFGVDGRAARYRHIG